MEQDSKVIFISFLGPTKYSSCNYYLDNKENCFVTKYVQEAILNLVFKNETDVSTFIFGTKTSFEKNWSGDQKLEEKTTSFAAEFCEIPDLFKNPDYGEEEIWKTFEIIFEKIDKDSKLYLDITHGFRFFPLLANALLNYCRFFKNTETMEIFYGCIDVLGGSKDREGIPAEKLFAPIMRLSSIHRLQQYSSAGLSMTRFANLEETADIMKSIAETFTKKEKDQRNSFYRLQRELKNLSNTIAFLRGPDIIRAKVFADLMDSIDSVKGLPKPAVPVFEKLKEEFKDFSENNPDNLFFIAKYCFNHKQAAQAATYLVEYIKTKLILRASLKAGLDQKEPFNEKNARDCVEAMLNGLTPDSTNFDYLKRLRDDEIYSKTLKVYRELKEIRNSMNHCSMGRKYSTESFAELCEEILSRRGFDLKQNDFNDIELRNFLDSITRQLAQFNKDEIENKINDFVEKRSKEQQQKDDKLLKALVQDPELKDFVNYWQSFSKKTRNSFAHAGFHDDGNKSAKGLNANLEKVLGQIEALLFN